MKRCWIAVIVVDGLALGDTSEAQQVIYENWMNSTYYENYYKNRLFDEIFTQTPFQSGQVELPLIAKGDLNNDGYDDFVTADLYDKNVFLYLRQGSAFAFSPGWVVLDAKAISSVRLIDLDLDRNVDLIVTGRLTGHEDIAILYGNGQGGFNQLIRLEAHSGPIGTYPFQRYTDKRPWLSCVNFQSRDVDVYEPQGRREYKRVDRMNFGPYPNCVVSVVDAPNHCTLLYAISRDDRSIWRIKLNARGQPITERDMPFPLNSDVRSVGTLQLSDRTVPIAGFERFFVNNVRYGLIRVLTPTNNNEFTPGQVLAYVQETVPQRIVSGDMLKNGSPVVAAYMEDDRVTSLSDSYFRDRYGANATRNSRFILTHQDSKGAWQLLSSLDHSSHLLPSNLLLSDIDGNGLQDLVFGYTPHGNMLMWMPMVRTKEGYGLLRPLAIPLASEGQKAEPFSMKSYSNWSVPYGNYLRLNAQRLAR